MGAVWPTGAALLVIVALLPQERVAANGNTPSVKQQLLSSIRADTDFLRNDIWTFWARYGLDKKDGGFFGTLDRRGAPVKPTDKGLVQTLRHAWAFSTFHKYGVGRDVSKKGLPSSHDMAKAAYDFAAAHLPDRKGSALFNWMVSKDGSAVVAANKVLYGEWFILYALSQYYAVFGEPKAKAFALNCFKAMDAAWHNSTSGGYNELVANNFPSTDTRDPAAQLNRTLNVMMHGTEALTALHRITKDSVVLERIKEYVSIICTKLTRTKGLIFEEYYVPADGSSKWQATATTNVNYGHNLESTWLITETLDYLLELGAIPKATADACRAIIMSIGAAAAEAGYDTTHGGVYENGMPGEAPASTVKVWWTQAESMLALWKLYKYTDDIAYLRKLAGTAKFVRRFVTDKYGEQFWQVAADGNYTIEYSPGYNVKGNMWKASYHSSRAALFLHDWINTKGV